MRPRTPAIVLLSLAALAACGAGSEPATERPSSPTEPGGDEGGVGPQAAVAGEFDFQGSTVMVGSLEQDERGCWSLAQHGERVFVVLPVGFEDDPSGTAVTAPDGAVIGTGTPVDVIGAPIGVDALPGGADGRWGNLLAFCAPDAASVVVASSLTADEFDPTELDDGALATLVGRAQFDEDWGCGFGFATATADQRVGLYIQPTGSGAPAPGRVTLPDERFDVTVVVGEHLFANHCDDVAEWFEPDRVVAATYPVTAGTFDYRPPADSDGCAGSGPVTVILDGALVATPAGEIALPTITIDNDAYGCFAG